MVRTPPRAHGDAGVPNAPGCSYPRLFCQEQRCRRWCQSGRPLGSVLTTPVSSSSVNGGRASTSGVPKTKERGQGEACGPAQPQHTQATAHPLCRAHGFARGTKHTTHTGPPAASVCAAVLTTSRTPLSEKSPESRTFYAGLTAPLAHGTYPQAPAPGPRPLAATAGFLRLRCRRL